MASLLHIDYNSPSSNSDAGGVVVYRHLVRLSSDGWEISIAASLAIDRPAFTTFVLAQRRWWWPPFRSNLPWLIGIRCRLIAKELVSRMVNRPDVISTVLNGVHAEVASAVAEELGVPLVAFFHDQPMVWGDFFGGRAFAEKLTKDVLLKTNRCYAVSASLVEKANSIRSGCAKLLLPIPSEVNVKNVSWRADFVRPHFYVIGSLYGVESTLERASEEIQKLGGKLTVICSPSQSNAAIRESYGKIQNITFLPAFATSDECVRHLVLEAAAILVPYPTEFDAASAFLRDSFPSRLVQFAQSGLPIIICARAEYAVVKWAKELDWKGLVVLDSNENWKLLGEVANAEKWSDLSGQVRRFARASFSPEEIHREFSSDLDCLLPSTRR